MSATHKRSVIGRGDIIDLLSTHDDDNLLLDEPVTPIQALGLRSYSPLIFQDGYKAEKKSTPDFQEASPAVFKAEDKLASYAQEASITDDQKAATTEPKRGGIISDGLAFIQSLIATPAKTYRSAVVVENPDEIDIDDDGEAGGEEWVTPRSRNELEALGEEHGEGAWPSAKNDDDIQPALTGNDNVSANVSQALPSITASTDSPKMSLKSQSAEYSSNVSGTPSPVVSRPNRFDEGRAAYLAEMAAAQASATRSKGPKAHFITGSAPKGSVRHARVYQRKELLEIGRKYRDVVLATLVANDHVGEKSIGIAMVSTGQAVGGIEGVVDVVRELGIGRGRGAL